MKFKKDINKTLNNEFYENLSIVLQEDVLTNIIHANMKELRCGDVGFGETKDEKIQNMDKTIKQIIQYIFKNKTIEIERL